MRFASTQVERVGLVQNLFNQGYQIHLATTQTSENKFIQVVLAQHFLGKSLEDRIRMEYLRKML